MWFEKIKKPIIGLAPMFGYSNPDLRLKSRQAGADVVFTEMVAAEAIIRDVDKAWEMLWFDEKERPVVVQIFGNNPVTIAKAIKMIDKKISPDGIDINFGCPVQKASKQGFGSILLNNPELSLRIVKSAVQATNIPISVKMRLPSKIVKDIVYFVQTVKDAGARLVTIHARTQTQKYGGHADWELLHKVKKSFPDLMILGNGDIETTQDIKDKLGNLDGVLVGRAAKRDFKIFSELKRVKE